MLQGKGCAAGCVAAQLQADAALAICVLNPIMHGVKHQVLLVQVFKQQADGAKMKQQQRHHAAKMQAGERSIAAQLQKEKEANQRVVAARKV